MAKANVILLNSILWNLREISKLADDIKAHCGDVECASWRYPLITCGELEIFKLLQNNRSLDNYTFILELTYDRLLYVFNLIIKYMESHDSLEKFRPERNVSRPRTLSLASVLCMIWERIKAQMETTVSGSGSGSGPSYSPEEKSNPGKGGERFDTEIEIKISKSTTCTQSEVCSISVCSCCEMVQEFVTQLVLELEKILEKQNLDSAITAERKSMKQTLIEMTNWSAMSKWLEAIIKDFNAIAEKFEQETSNSRKLRNRMDTDEKKLKIKTEQYEEEIRFLQAKLRDGESKMASMKEDRETYIKERNQLREEVASKNAEIASITFGYETKVGNLRKSYESKLLRQREKKNRKEMEKEKEWKRKLETECKRREVIESETQRLGEALSQANEEISLLAEEKVRLETRCEASEKNVENLRDENSHLKSLLSQKQTVIDDYSKRIMQAFPQLNDTPKAAYRASGNPEIDMANQIEANNIRMDLLNAENEKLQKALDKMKSLKVGN